MPAQAPNSPARIGIVTCKENILQTFMAFASPTGAGRGCFCALSERAHVNRGLYGVGHTVQYTSTFACTVCMLDNIRLCSLQLGLGCPAHWSQAHYLHILVLAQRTPCLIRQQSRHMQCRAFRTEDSAVAGSNGSKLSWTALSGMEVDSNFDQQDVESQQPNLLLFWETGQAP